LGTDAKWNEAQAGCCAFVLFHCPVAGFDAPLAGVVAFDGVLRIGGKAGGGFELSNGGI